MEKTLYCIITIVVYFVLIFIKRKVMNKYHSPVAAFLGVFLEILIFLGFVIILAAISGFRFNYTEEELFKFFEERGSDLVWSIVVVIIASTWLGIAKTLLFRKRKLAKLPKEEAELIEKRSTTVAKVLMSLNRYLTYIICIIVVLGIWGVNVMPALAGLGIVGLVIGLGAQKLIGDFVSGIFIVFEHHFDVGDIIEVDDFKGEVIDIGLKTTKIKNWEGRVMIMSNSELSVIINDSVFDTTFGINIPVSYDLDPKLVMEKLNQGLEKRFKGQPNIISVPTCAGVNALDSSSVNILILATVKAETQYSIIRQLKQAVKEICEENNFEIPYQQIVLHKGDK